MKKKKINMLVLGIMLVALAAPAAVYAYFTDYEDAWGGAVIELEGQTTIQEQADSDKKVISIENTGDTDVVVRVGVYGDYIKNYDIEDEDDWTQDGEWFYYEGILEPGKSTSEITVNIDKDKAEAAGHDFDIVVVHESERVTYEGARAADGSIVNHVSRPDDWSGKWQLPDTAVAASEEVGD